METLIKIFAFLAIGGTITTLYACLVVASDADDKEEEILRRKHEQQEKELYQPPRTEPEPTGHEGQDSGGVGQRYSDI